jgi:hypothetical protein
MCRGVESAAAAKAELAQPALAPPLAQPDAEWAGWSALPAAHSRQCASSLAGWRFPARESPKPMVVGQRGPMPQLTTHLTIDAPADEVWQVIGPGFARIGEWATTIPASAAIPAPAPAAATPVAPRAPVLGRTCSTGTRLMPDITETLTDYDEDRRTLSYQAAGLPAFITAARSTWTVTPAGETTCRVTVTGHFQTRGVLGLVGCWAILAQARHAARHLQADLRHYIKHGTPSPRKQRQLARGR